MSNRRKICVITGTRAEYGLLYWLMKEIGSDEELELDIIVTGMHLIPQFGLTYKVIEADGFKIARKIDMMLASDTAAGITKSIGLGTVAFADAFQELRPDILVVLGDRFEILSAVQAAMIAKITIAHIHGGEVTEGAFDESIRHTLTKMSHYHFVAAEEYRKRVIQLGETPETVFNFGAPGLDQVDKMEWLDAAALEQSLGMTFHKTLFLVTYHPATFGKKEPVAAMKELLYALDAFPDVSVIITYPNADTGGRDIIFLIDEWVQQNSHRAKSFTSLGQQRYLSLMRVADVIIGNSSSGLIEAPVFKKPVINIGDRQKGRLKANCIIDAGENKEEITAAIKKALSPEFQLLLPATVSLYGSGKTSWKIKEKLKTVPLTISKSFFDISHDH